MTFEQRRMSVTFDRRFLSTTYEVYVIRLGSLYYKHDSTGERWVSPRLSQTYDSKSAATRQARKLGNCRVVQCRQTVANKNPQLTVTWKKETANGAG
jgi:hypothetical protein